MRPLLIYVDYCTMANNFKNEETVVLNEETVALTEGVAHQLNIGLDEAFRKILSKNLINICLRTENSNEFNLSGGGGADLISSNRYQKIWMGFAGQILPINAFRISIVTPKPYILPSFIEIKEVKLLLEKS